MNSACIVGYGRFGQLLAELLREDYEVRIFDNDESRQKLASDRGFQTVGLNELGDAETIFICVPISVLEEFLKSAKEHISKKAVVMDVCAVKSYPLKLLKEHLSENQLLGTHPLFGPDSAKNGLKGLKIVFCNISAEKKIVAKWKHFWQSKGIRVQASTADEHDHDMIYSLGLTQTLARFVNRMDLPELTMTTRNFDAVNDILRLALSDTDQLFHDMLRFNPYFDEMKEKFAAAGDKTTDYLNNIANEMRY